MLVWVFVHCSFFEFLSTVLRTKDGAELTYEYTRCSSCILLVKCASLFVMYLYGCWWILYPRWCIVLVFFVDFLFFFRSTCELWLLIWVFVHCFFLNPQAHSLADRGWSSYEYTRRFSSILLVKCPICYVFVLLLLNSLSMIYRSGFLCRFLILLLFNLWIVVVGLSFCSLLVFWILKDSIADRQSRTHLWFKGHNNLNFLIFKNLKN